MRNRLRFANPVPSWPVSSRRFTVVHGGFLIDLPGPMSLEWTLGTARKRVGKIEHAITVERPIPVLTGLAFVAAPYAAGAAIVAFAPPWIKPIGLSMMVPGPSDPLLFAAGYAVGEEIETIFD